MPPRITHPDGEKGARGEAAAGKVDPHCDGGTGGGGGAVTVLRAVQSGFYAAAWR